MSQDFPAVGDLAGRLYRLTRKEIATILRDRRTIITLVLMPLLLYPLLTIAFQQFLLASAPATGTPGDRFRIGIKSEAEARTVARFLGLGDSVLRSEENLKSQDTAASQSPRPDIILIYPLDDFQVPLRDRQIDIGIELTTTEVGNRPEAFRTLKNCRLYYVEDSPRGLMVLAYVEDRLQAAHRMELYRISSQVAQRAPELLPPHERPTLLRPIREAVRVTDRKGTVPLEVLMPLILILMTITGAVYPAIDLTAGERERGTLEVLVAAPIPRLGLLFAKYVSVWVVAVLTAVVNLGTMTVTILFSGLAPVLFEKVASPTLTMIQVFALLLLFAAFFSAVLLAVCSFARSFKEAQAYLVPLMLVSLAPGMISLIPDIKLQGMLLAAPLLNVVLLARDLFTGTATAPTAAVVVLSTILYSLAAIGLAARIFGAEAVLYNEQGSWGDLFRRPIRPRSAPSVPAVLLVLALAFPISFVINGLLRQIGTGDPELLLALMAISTAGLFLGLPLASAWLGRIEYRPAFGLSQWRAWAWLPAVFLGLSLAPWASELIQLLREMGVGSVRPQQMDAAERFLAALRRVSPVFVVLVLAVVPAVAEELCFRGYLFAALERAVSPGRAILASALLFGLFHLLTQGALMFERLLVTTLLGVVLGWVRARSGSVVPGILLHATHNALIILLGLQRPHLESAGWLQSGQQHVPVLWLIVSAVLAGMGGLGIVLACRPDSRPPAGHTFYETGNRKAV